MLRDTRQQNIDSRLVDTPSAYGWLSIAMHWITAIAIIALWFLGQRIDSAGTTDADARRALHVSVAAAVWLVVLFRVVWRLRSGHPRVHGLTAPTHAIAKWVHYLMLAIVSLMLLSGPLMVWAGGQPIAIFGLVSIPGPFGDTESLRELAHTIHGNSARALFVLVLVHLGAALKHLMFHSDDSIVRMLWPPKRDERGAGG